jgi:hypothetical protein
MAVGQELERGPWTAHLLLRSLIAMTVNDLQIEEGGPLLA